MKAGAVSSARITAENLRNIIYIEAIPRSQKLEISRIDPLQLFKVSTYMSILEQAASILNLFDSGLAFHGLPLLRAQLEGLADILNINNNPGYYKNIELQFEDSRKNRMVAAKNGNRYLQSIAQGSTLTADLSECGKRIKTLVRKGARKMEPKEKLKLAGLSEEYEALYGYLNDHSHGGIGALLSRHFRDDGEERIVVAFSHASCGEFDAPMQTSTDIVLKSSEAIHRSFGTGEQDFFRREIARLSY